MLLVLIKIYMLFLPSNNNNFKLFFFFFFFHFCPFCRNLCGNKRKREKESGIVVTAEEVHPLPSGDS